MTVLYCILFYNYGVGYYNYNMLLLLSTYVCKYVYEFVCMYEIMFVYLCVCMCMYVSVYECVHVNVCMYVRM